MTGTPTTRRTFLLDLARATTAVGAAVLPFPLIASVTDGFHGSSQFAHLSAAEARTMRAFAAQLIPSDVGASGAEEAGAVFFVDQAFGNPFFAEMVPVIRAGLAALDARGFASLSGADQRAILHAVEHEPFFAAARTLVIIGTFGDPSHGGNRGGVGARIVRMDPRPHYMAPYGWYDAHV
ncbi:MAG TPA: gluconate 2-dehydrogenase subunit 3 family protein [Gemmatimonadaceae bacterium]|nr:gluconate 2-dehydrogenase subunit 3 family protein [Gemmatimonadaceae bacterium]